MLLQEICRNAAPPQQLLINGCAHGGWQQDFVHIRTAGPPVYKFAISLAKPRVLSSQQPFTNVPAELKTQSAKTNSSTLVFNSVTKTLNTLLDPKRGQHAPAASSPVAISEHARDLGSLPKDLFKGRRRHRRKWTGFIEGQRMWAGRRVILPTQETATIVEVRFRFAKVRTSRFNADGSSLHVYLPVEQLKVWKNPAAVALGRRKRNVLEQKSALKAITARENGRQPPRPGKVKGRPRKGGARASAGLPSKPYEPRWMANWRQKAFAESLLALDCNKKTIKQFGAGDGLRLIELERKKDAWNRLIIRTVKARDYATAAKLIISPAMA